MQTLLDHDNVAFLVFEASRLMRRSFDEQVKEMGLTRAQWQVLAYLRRQEGINQVRLADVLEVEPITISRLLDRMQKGQWVERRPDPKDRRAHVLYLGARAKEAMKELHELREKTIAEAFAGISEAERDQLRAMLRKLCANLAHFEYSADSRAKMGNVTVLQARR